MLPVPTVDDLSSFSGRAKGSYGPYAVQALTQSTLMFTVAAGLEAWPDDPDLMQVGINAILEMADKLTLEQPYQAVKSGPFQSETIGSYSYSKSASLARATAVGAQVTENVGAGLFWWPIALDLLSQRKSLLTASGSIAVHVDGLVRDEHTHGLRIENPVVGDGPDRPPYIRIS